FDEVASERGRGPGRDAVRRSLGEELEHREEGALPELRKVDRDRSLPRSRAGILSFRAFDDAADGDERPQVRPLGLGNVATKVGDGGRRHAEDEAGLGARWRFRRSQDRESKKASKDEGTRV